MCDVIPGVTKEFRGALGSLNRPYAIPNDQGEEVTIRLHPTGCDVGSPGFSDFADATRHLDRDITVHTEAITLPLALVGTTGFDYTLGQSLPAFEESVLRSSLLDGSAGRH